MSEKETVFSSKISYRGVFSFADFYSFCHTFLTEDLGFGVSEGKYSEKISGESKNIDVSWSGSKDVTDYFKFNMGVGFKVVGLTKVEVVRGKEKISTNKGSITINIKGELIRDYKGKFEISATKKFMRSIYEKWVISSRLDQMEDALAGACDGFLSQAKAYLDLEGKK